MITRKVNPDNGMAGDSSRGLSRHGRTVNGQPTNESTKPAKTNGVPVTKVTNPTPVTRKW